jgi:predicted membrane channel-forming protein YqfA (hemolysin III family)
MISVEKILYWLLGLFVVYLIIEIIRKMFGGSLGFEEIVIGLLIANLGYVFYLQRDMSKIDSKISGHIGWHKGKGDSD